MSEKSSHSGKKVIYTIFDISTKLANSMARTVWVKGLKIGG